MIDPDYPDRREPNQKEMLHWLVVNTPGNNLLMGESLFEYMTPEPPAYSGKSINSFIKDKLRQC